MYAPRRLREIAAVAGDVEGFDDEDGPEEFRDLLLEALETDPAVRAAVRRLLPAAAKPKPVPRGGRRG
jgi:hypothetical protein